MFTITKNAKTLSMALMVVGLIALIFGFYTDAHAAWPSLLFNTYFYLGISVFAVFFIAMQYVSEAAWSIVIKRIPEAIMSFLPVTGIIMLIILISAAMHFGGNHIYHWIEVGIMTEGTENYDEIIAGKEAWADP